MPLTKEQIQEIATKTADEVVARMQTQEIMERDFIIGTIIGEGAIPVHGRENRKAPCRGCRIDPSKPLGPGNVMATTEDAIGTLSPSEVRNWCSEIVELQDGRCKRAREIKEAARECKEKSPNDTGKFFTCFVPAFAAVTKKGEDAPVTPEVIKLTPDDLANIQQAVADTEKAQLVFDRANQLIEQGAVLTKNEAIESAMRQIHLEVTPEITEQPYLEKYRGLARKFPERIDKHIERARDEKASLVLGREFGESTESYFSRRPDVKKRWDEITQAIDEMQRGAIPKAEINQIVADLNLLREEKVWIDTFKTKGASIIHLQTGETATIIEPPQTIYPFASYEERAMHIKWANGSEMVVDSNDFAPSALQKSIAEITHGKPIPEFPKAKKVTSVTPEVTEREARYGFLQLNEAEYNEALKSGRYPEPTRYEKLTGYYTESHEPGWKGLSLAEMFPTKYKELLKRGVPDKLSPLEVKTVIEEKRIPYGRGVERGVPEASTPEVAQEARGLRVMIGNIEDQIAKGVTSPGMTEQLRLAKARLAEIEKVTPVTPEVTALRAGELRPTTGIMATEGYGLYVTSERETAEAFAERFKIKGIQEVKYTKPRNPLVLEPTDELPSISWEARKKADKWLFSPIKPDDTAWVRLHKQVAIDIGLLKGAPPTTEFNKQLDKLIREAGYNAVIVPEGGLARPDVGFTVLLDESLYKAIPKAQAGMTEIAPVKEQGGTHG